MDYQRNQILDVIGEMRRVSRGPIGLQQQCVDVVRLAMMCSETEDLHGVNELRGQLPEMVFDAISDRLSSEYEIEF